MPKKCAKIGQNVMLRHPNTPFYIIFVEMWHYVIDIRKNVCRASKIKCLSGVFYPLFIARIVKGINFAPGNTENVQRGI